MLRRFFSKSQTIRFVAPAYFVLLGGLTGCSSDHSAPVAFNPHPIAAQPTKPRKINPPASPAPALSYKEQLEKILRSEKYADTEIEEMNRVIHTPDGFFTVDDHDGSLYFENKAGQRTAFDILDGLKFVSHAVGGHIALPANPEDQRTLGSLQRSFGTFSLKTRNSECYFKLAQDRLKGGDVYERLLALERPIDPRPLIFKDDAQWAEFKKDLKRVFSVFHGGGHIFILGSSTTFISQNPRKGSTKDLFQLPPDCDHKEDIYTFDKPGGTPSDLDINLLIPELSHLCQLNNQIYPKGGKRIRGNGANDERAVYSENELEKCIWLARDPKIQGLYLQRGDVPYDPKAKTQQPITLTVKNQNHPPVLQVFHTVEEMSRVHQMDLNSNKLLHMSNGPLRDFVLKWSDKLRDQNGNPREINLNARILPDYLANPTHRRNKYAAGTHDFSHDPSLKNRFMIEIK